ncbi:hypothetical protein BDB00DRAFT_831378 [Zychaea mexicana]|uniref:uncharacterized protein n=1 Tax=Zychaea mexicana TaxID=64656 RepID=UPI0022FEDC35|nr:uncharacterized protein BDB00DRAFT_831378 [Zychaea mexicana]KAI9491766.1 hypothetical protein BDB00DRAFT_831378 [Zychaea mexicana]
MMFANHNASVLLLFVESFATTYMYFLSKDWNLYIFRRCSKRGMLHTDSCTKNTLYTRYLYLSRTLLKLHSTLLFYLYTSKQLKALLQFALLSKFFYQL